MIRTVILRIFVNSAALWFTDVMFPGIWFESTGALIAAAIVFGLLNSFIKPFLLLFTLPINILTLGLFTFVINAVILEMTDAFVQSFHLAGFGTALLASVVISIVSVFLQWILED